MNFAFALWWTSIVSLAATTAGRHLWPYLVPNNTQFQLSPRLVLDTALETAPLPATPITPTTPSTPTTSSTPPSDEDETDEDESDIGLAPPASDELWSKHTRKGTSLDCSMRGTDTAAGYQLNDPRTPPSAASVWTGGLPQLQDWYWRASSFDSRICNLDLYWGMGTTIRALGLSTTAVADGGDLHCFQLRHMDERAKYPDGAPMEALAHSHVVDGKMYHATDVSHFFAMDIRSGAITGIALLGLNIAAERTWGWKPASDQLPKLHKVSDLFWAHWSSLHSAAGTRVSDLNKYVVYSIQNYETDQIIAWALMSVGKDRLEPWPGHYFPIESSQGLALLGSSIGATIGYLLMQHKRELGNKYVTGIHILRNDFQTDDTIQETDLVFHIADVPPEKSIPDVPSRDPPHGQTQSVGSIVPQVVRLTSRNVPGYSVEEQLHGLNNVRVHKIMVV